MGKKVFSLCMALALCLGLLPVTALAAECAPSQLYVGNQQVIRGSDNATYWTTDTDGNLTQSAAEQSWNVKYDPVTVTLTLRGATIQGGTNTGPAPFGSGIYAQCSIGQSVTLTIKLIGENTITGYYGIYVNAEMSANSYGTDASLNITGNGSLIVTDTNNHGLFVKSGTGTASLNINDASVVASSSSSYSGYAGVYVMSSMYATNSPKISLSVDGGSLTASGTGKSDGILLYVGSTQATGATTSLTVSDNAIVRAENGINAYRVDKPTLSGTGIVFDGTEGTVYGTVELQKDLEIKSGETLTIPQGSSLNARGKLTNEGTINVESGGSVSGNLSDGTPLRTPPISQQPQSTTVTEGSTAEFSITASDAQTYQWQRKATYTESEWENISDATTTSYTTAATTTSMNGYQYRCVVTGSGGVSVISQTATLTVQAKPASVPVTGVTLDKTTLELFTGGSATLTATVQPDDATKKNVTWSSNNADVATVDANGLVTAVSAGTATITVTTEDGNKTASCTVTVTVPVTGVTLSQTQASLYYNRTPSTLTLTATVTPDNATNKDVTWTSSNPSAATVNQNGVVTAVAPGTAVITATAADGNGANATCTVTVSRYSSGGGSSRPTPSLSDQAIDDIQDARPGDTVEITLRPGRTTLEREVFEELAGQDITLEIDAGDGVLWTVNGLDIPEDTRLHDLDLDVDLGDSDIPATVLNAVTGEISTVQLSLAHDGEFGFTMTLSAPLGRDNADYWANLYWYNERTEELEFQQAARIAKDGTAEFALDHASDYAIVIDDRSHEPVDLPFNDVPEGYWAYDAIQYVYGEGLMAGTSGSTFNPEGTTTRGQIVTILWRLSGNPVVNYLMDFDDVDPAAYYAEAIRWATSEGIAGGYGGGVFGPDDPITREQLAVMLHRYAQHEGYDVSIGEDTNILSYADAFDVSEYAVAALQWACGAGIISGTGDGSTLTPQGEATRAQAATVLMRFCNMYGNP